MGFSLFSKTLKTKNLETVEATRGLATLWIRTELSVSNDLVATLGGHEATEKLLDIPLPSAHQYADEIFQGMERSSQQNGVTAVEDSNRQEAQKEIVKRAAEDMETVIWEVDDIFHPGTGDRVLVPHDPSRIPVPDKEAVVPDDYDKWVIVLRRVFHPDQTLWKVMLDIKSPLVLDVLMETLLEQKAALASQASVKWPNRGLCRYREKIKAAAARKGDLCVKHVAVLLGLIHQKYASDIRDSNELLPKGTSNFDILWEAFWPGDIVVDGATRAYRVTDLYYGRDPLGNSIFCIQAEYIDCDGEKFKTVRHDTNITKFDGIRYIHELPLVPLKYHRDSRNVVDYLVKRGSKFEALKGQHFKSYMEVAKRDSSGETITSRVIIDTTAISRLRRRLRHESVYIEDIDDEPVKDELMNGTLTEDHLMICTNTIPFFSLRDHKFHYGDIERLHDIEFNEEIFSQLALPANTKHILREVIKSHVNGLAFDDFTKGKGKGLVLLLHGPPGVGKTMTAEAVAEYTKRPLYSVTSGELGASANDVERNLNLVLDITETFRAVLLLDEADVFMEKRSSRNIPHNALVSVFLRALEYYGGILILTTNRIETIDDAFHSRIHLRLDYPALNHGLRESIWRNFGKLAGGVDISDVEYSNLGNKELNGRQIKNVFGLCKALAGENKRKVTKELIDMALEVMDSQLSASSVL
ncbi:P-loop containing nucleoside triphosphate hydrolase protein [Aspergillus ambiguus]|uniref:ATP-binding protein n=1 Tax=Aspergillus ambiguus TaxID=176160 RepID=UPI003CCE5228